MMTDVAVVEGKISHNTF